MATAGAGGRAGLGWVILAAALAVPGFFAYTWWSQRAEHERGVAAKARTRVAEGSVFQTSPASARPGMAVAASTAAANAAPAGLAPTAVAPASRASAAAPNALAPAVAAPAATAPAGKMAPAAAATPASAVAAPFAPTVSTATVLTLSRDPMMSPMDLVRQREAELEAERNAEAIRRANEERNRPRRKIVRKEPQIDSHIELQGIVARPDGDNLAIVNGATVNPGEHFTVEGFSAKVKVIRITSSEVTFEYKGRKFKKGVNAE